MTTPENPAPVMMPPMYRRDSSLAIASLICSLAGWVFLPFFGALAAVITGHLAKKEIRESHGQLGGDGMAIAGLILGYTQLGIILLAALCFIVFMIISVSSTSTNFNGPYTFLMSLI
jgi:hypothetical protein